MPEESNDQGLTRRCVLKLGLGAAGAAIAGSGLAKIAEMAGVGKTVEAGETERVVEINMKFRIFKGGAIVTSAANIRSEPKMLDGSVISARGAHKDYLIINPELVDGDPYTRPTGKEPWVKFKGWLGRNNYAALGIAEVKIDGEDKEISRLETESGKVRYEDNGKTLEVGIVIELPQDQQERAKIFQRYGLKFN
ncbi:MAG: hypothetical protein Q8Q15_01085 [bacterium]|nr:hypothetical protein [bacterium]